MKRFLKKRWIGLPVGIITVVLLVLALTGTALAVNGYTFFRGNVNAEVREAIAVGAFATWDNLHPYGSDVNAVWDEGEEGDGAGILGDVEISIAPDGEDVYTLTIATLGSRDYVGTGFVAGEWIVIPINLRNGSSVALDLGANASANGLVLDYCWAQNLGPATSRGDEGQYLDYRFRDNGNWFPLAGFSETIDGYGGKSGSAIVGAQVLFVKITVPQDAVPRTYDTVTFTLARGVTQ